MSPNNLKAREQNSVQSYDLYPYMNQVNNFIQNYVHTILLNNNRERNICNTDLDPIFDLFLFNLIFLNWCVLWSNQNTKVNHYGY